VAALHSAESRVALRTVVEFGEAKAANEKAAIEHALNNFNAYILLPSAGGRALDSTHDDLVDPPLLR
jgi:hypothetical protein